MVLGNYEKKKKRPHVRLKWGPETSFGTPYQKSANTLKLLMTQVSFISQQKKVNTISHMRQTEGLTKTFEESSKSRGVFRTQVNICDGAFL